jgi:hypothetical protein
VQNYATLAAPLTNLLRSTKFTWNSEAESAFTKLKENMTTTPIVTLPNFPNSSLLKQMHPKSLLAQCYHKMDIRWLSSAKKMCNRMQSSSIYVQEMYATTEAVKK